MFARGDGPLNFYFYGFIFCLINVEFHINGFIFVCAGDGPLKFYLCDIIFYLINVEFHINGFVFDLRRAIIKFKGILSVYSVIKVHIFVM